MGQSFDEVEDCAGFHRHADLARLTDIDLPTKPT